MPVKDPGTLSVSGVFFTCPLTGATLTKSEREVHIKEAILMVRLTWTSSLAFVSTLIKTLLTPLECICNIIQLNAVLADAYNKTCSVFTVRGLRKIQLRHLL